jgi:hypothetical protein
VQQLLSVDGAGHANLTSVTLSPQSATTTSSTQGQVGYTATGHFQNEKSRELSQVDGLSWKTSQTSTGTVAATIGSTGEVTCSAPGTVTITASAPANLSFNFHRINERCGDLSPTGFTSELPTIRER